MIIDAWPDDNGGIEMVYLVVGTAGHIDHGKSSLVKVLSGIDPDRLQEEKKRGITVELGFAYLQLPGETCSRWYPKRKEYAGGVAVLIFLCSSLRLIESPLAKALCDSAAFSVRK